MRRNFDRANKYKADSICLILYLLPSIEHEI